MMILVVVAVTAVSRPRLSHATPKPFRSNSEGEGDTDGLLNKCQWTDPISGVSYDLSPLVSSTSYQFAGTVFDPAKDSSHNAPGFIDSHHPKGIWDGADWEGYKYVMNFCNQVLPKPAKCVDKRGHAGAYQVTMDKFHGSGNEPHPENCYALGSANNMSWSLIDPAHPKRGVRLTYNGGESCLKRVRRGGLDTIPSDGSDLGRLGDLYGGNNREEGKARDEWVPVPRTFHIDMVCSKRDRGPEGITKSVLAIIATEREMCEYGIRWPSRYGCSVDVWKGMEAQGLPVNFKKNGWWHGSDYSQSWSSFFSSTLSLVLRGAVVLVAIVLMYRMYTSREDMVLLAPSLIRFDTKAWKLLGKKLLAGSVEGVPRQGKRMV